MSDKTEISVLLPSRDRPGLLERSVRSLLDLAAAPDRVQVHIAADDDDPATIAAAAGLRADCLVTGRQGYGRLHVYYQRLAGRAQGEWLLTWNDDAVMTTHGWDAMIAALPPGVLVADLQSRHSPGLCCFPAVRRAAVNALGRFSTDNPHVDTFWQDVGRATGSIAAVEAWVEHDQPDGQRDGTDGFYEPEHQAALAACSAVLSTLTGALR